MFDVREYCKLYGIQKQLYFIKSSLFMTSMVPLAIIAICFLITAIKPIIGVILGFLAIGLCGTIALILQLDFLIDQFVFLEGSGALKKGNKIDENRYIEETTDQVGRKKYETRMQYEDEENVAIGTNPRQNYKSKSRSNGINISINTDKSKTEYNIMGNVGSIGNETKGSAELDLNQKEIILKYYIPLFLSCQEGNPEQNLLNIMQELFPSLLEQETNTALSLNKVCGTLRQLHPMRLEVRNNPNLQQLVRSFNSSLVEEFDIEKIKRVLSFIVQSPWGKLQDWKLEKANVWKIQHQIYTNLIKSINQDPNNRYIALNNETISLSNINRDNNNIPSNYVNDEDLFWYMTMIRKYVVSDIDENLKYAIYAPNIAEMRNICNKELGRNLQNPTFNDSELYESTDAYSTETIKSPSQDISKSNEVSRDINKSDGYKYITSEPALNSKEAVYLSSDLSESNKSISKEMIKSNEVSTEMKQKYKEFQEAKLINEEFQEPKTTNEKPQEIEKFDETIQETRKIDKIPKNVKNELIGLLSGTMRIDQTSLSEKYYTMSGNNMLIPSGDSGIKFYVIKGNQSKINFIYPSELIKAKIGRDYYISSMNILQTNGNVLNIVQPAFVKEDNFGNLNIVEKGIIKISMNTIDKVIYE